MGNEIAVKVSIKPTWSIIKDIQDKTIAYMDSKNMPKGLTESTIMCITELIENAIKYGTEDSSNGNIEFDLHTRENFIEITVKNGIRNKNDINQLIDNITKIQNSDDHAKLYTDRLMELMDNPKPGVSQLGLYRIAYEGEFDIDYKYENNTLTIIARKNLEII